MRNSLSIIIILDLSFILSLAINVFVVDVSVAVIKGLPLISLIHCGKK